MTKKLAISFVLVLVSVAIATAIEFNIQDFSSWPPLAVQQMEDGMHVLIQNPDETCPVKAIELILIPNMGRWIIVAYAYKDGDKLRQFYLTNDGYKEKSDEPQARLPKTKI